MKKLFLIPLMTLLCSVMAWANVAKIGETEYATLEAAVNAATTGQTITLIDDVTSANYGENLINITKNLTLDGNGHQISAYKNCELSISEGKTLVKKTVFALNRSGSSAASLDVKVKNLNIIHTGVSDRIIGFAIFDGVDKFSLDAVTTDGHGVNKDLQALLITGADAEHPLNLTITNSNILNKVNYATYILKPINATITNTTIFGYCALYFKKGWSSGNSGYGNTVGSRGSVVTANNCTFNCINAYPGESNNFAVFALEDDGITLNLNNCSVNAENLAANDGQRLVNLQYNLREDGATGQDVYINIYGDNTHIYNIENDNPNLVIWNGWVVGQVAPSASEGLGAQTFSDIHVSISGGTLNINPEDVRWFVKADNKPKATINGQYTDQSTGTGAISIPSTHEVQEVQQGTKTLYRVVKKAASYVDPETSETVLYDLNDYVPVEGEGYGDNPVSSFDLSTGADMTLNNEITKAGYVQIKDNATEGATTVTVGQTAGGQDQTLIINNGLDVQGNSQVIVESGATLQIGEGGIVTSKPENIIIEADENGAASLLLDPTITVNQTPDLTVRMLAKQIGKSGADYYWHRFAMPVDAGITSWEKEGNLSGTTYPTFLYGWDYTNNDWLLLPNGVADMEPMMGYTLTLASDEIPVTERQDVTYIFKGNLVGNTNQALNFTAEGFNFFGNSYTGYMDVLTLIQGLQSNHVEGTVYMWCNDPTDGEGRYQSYEGVPLYKLTNPSQRERLASWQKEVAPMQTFILRLRGEDSANEEVDYASAIWGNPRYGHAVASAPVRRTAVVNNEESFFEIFVKAANGKGSRVDFTQDANHNDAFESGYDVVKYMNERTINLYSTIEGENLSSVVSNTLEGKTLSLNTNDEISYTMTFKNVEGTAYAIWDKVTNQIVAIEEGATYEFAAQPNSTVEGRFEIVGIHRMPTAIENTEAAKSDVKGIYTIMGQYLGEDFESLPAGVYVVNGVKIVK